MSMSSCRVKGVYLGGLVPGKLEKARAVCQIVGTSLRGDLDGLDGVTAELAQVKVRVGNLETSTVATAAKIAALETAVAPKYFQFHVTPDGHVDPDWPDAGGAYMPEPLPGNVSIVPFLHTRIRSNPAFSFLDASDDKTRFTFTQAGTYDIAVSLDLMCNYDTVAVRRVNLAIGLDANADPDSNLIAVTPPMTTFVSAGYRDAARWTEFKHMYARMIVNVQPGNVIRVMLGHERDDHVIIDDLVNPFKLYVMGGSNLTIEKKD
jgi:hypothetical protein